MNPISVPRARGTYAYRFHYLCMRVPVSYIDRKLSQLAASYSCEPFEKCLQFLTAIGDEKILGSASLVAWIIAGLQDTKPNKYQHLLITLIVITAIDHLSKHVFDQRRPDRVRKRYRKRGIPRSSGEYDSFPSGHTMRLGAAARALLRAHPQASVPIWSIVGLVASTRVLLLAHWFSDVAVGTLAGIVGEELLHRLENTSDRRPRPRG
jgi:undecaprenyl-diphosphatase